MTRALLATVRFFEVKKLSSVLELRRLPSLGLYSIMFTDSHDCRSLPAPSPSLLICMAFLYR